MQPQSLDNAVFAFLLDENVSEHLIPLLVLFGYHATSVGRLGWKGRNDAEQLIGATSLSRIVVTYDVEDDELLHLAWRTWSKAWNLDPPPLHPGILTIRPVKGLSQQEIAGAIDSLVKGETSLANRFFGWTHQGGWEERL